MKPLHLILVLGVATLSQCLPSPQSMLRGGPGIVPLAPRFHGIVPHLVQRFQDINPFFHRFNYLIPGTNRPINPLALQNQRYQNQLWLQNQANLNVPMSGQKEQPIGTNEIPCEEELQALNDKVQSLNLLNNDQRNPMLANPLLLNNQQATANMQLYPQFLVTLQQVFRSQIPPQILLSLQQSLANGQPINLPPPLIQLLLSQQGVQGNRPLYQLLMNGLPGQQQVFPQQPLVIKENDYLPASQQVQPGPDGNVQANQPLINGQLNMFSNQIPWINNPQLSLNPLWANQQPLLGNNIPQQLPGQGSLLINQWYNPLAGQLWANEQPQIFGTNGASYPNVGQQLNQSQILPQQSQQPQIMGNKLPQQLPGQQSLLINNQLYNPLASAGQLWAGQQPPVAGINGGAVQNNQPLFLGQYQVPQQLYTQSNNMPLVAGQQTLLPGANGGVVQYQPLQVSEQPCDPQLLGNIIPLQLVVSGQQASGPVAPNQPQPVYPWESQGNSFTIVPLTSNQQPFFSNMPVVANEQNNGGMMVSSNQQQPMSGSAIQPAVTTEPTVSNLPLVPEGGDVKPALAA